MRSSWDAKQALVGGSLHLIPGLLRCNFISSWLPEDWQPALGSEHLLLVTLNKGVEWRGDGGGQVKRLNMLVQT